MVQGLINQAKATWEQGQPFRDAEKKMVNDVGGYLKAGDYGRAAEAILGHLTMISGAPTSMGQLKGELKQAGQNILDNATGANLNKGETMNQVGIFPGPGVSEALGDFAAEVPPAASGPGIVKQVIKGADISQPEAQEALRSGAKASGVPSVEPKSLRTVVEQPIDALDSSAKSLYRQIDQAAGTDFKALNEKLANTEYQIRQLTETEEDVAKEAALEKSRTAILDKIDAAKQEALKAGVDPKVLDQADAHFKQARALSDLETKVFKNPSIVGGNTAFGSKETVDVDKAIRQLQKLQDVSKYGGSRLEEALGKQGAGELLEKLYAAQRAGTTAVKYQQIAKWIAGLGIGGAITREALK